MTVQRRPRLPVKLSRPVKVDVTEFPTFEVEQQRFARQGKRMSPDGMFVELDHDLEGKGGMERLRRFWNKVVHGNMREYIKYDPHVLAKYYDRQPFVVGQRVTRIVVPFSAWMAQFLVARGFQSDKNGQLNPKATKRLAAALRNTLVRMGPTFVKIGQALSQRPDIAGPDFCEELKKLQDGVATFDSAQAFRIMEAEFNRPLDQIFDFITPEPIAAASLGQVYKAHLIGAPVNEFVAVKVQRPRIGTDASVDLYLTRKLAGTIRKLLKLRTDLIAVNDEFAYRLFDETNYVQEARNCDRFGSLYSDIEGIFIPKTYPQWTTRYVLTMEWVEGTKAPWGEDALSLIDVGIQCTLRQLLDAGFFHADPHPGNLLRTVDGRLAYLDFGMMSEVEPQKRYDLIGSVMHLINKDYALLTEDLVKLDFLPPDADRKTITPLLEEAFSKASGGGETMSDLSFNKLAQYMAGVAFKSPIRLPPYYSLIIRSLTILEGIALTENEDFKIIDESFPYVSQRILTDTDPELRKRLREVLIDPNTGRLRWNRLRNIIREGEGRPGEHHGTHLYGEPSSPSDDSIVEKMVEYLMSEEGAFLRDALVEDVVDTVDSAQLAVLDNLSNLTRGILPKPLDQPNRELLGNVGTLLNAIAGELRRTNRRSPTRQIQNAASASVNGAGSVFLNASSIRNEASRAARVVLGGLLERNSRRAIRSMLSIVEGAIDRQVDLAERVNRRNKASRAARVV
eukprot:CAMPEP_0198726334 /NCGR_PEP_ID=MMETSP1475-20131203/3415_1 /TAXON_ID= ORGANISM="Unidentified sp., Strain CCMP1999" /NCGR_SAMPLE_ID=MMETSP1475 /ASSEMBLY_ACC=CAM_ASM_001111 /LENGTH=735 /DNA_ID=CAMNT_0044488241 /DNA_START=152 /DNA_END=2356 /DNA_ORIENTATION=-